MANSRCVERSRKKLGTLTLHLEIDPCYRPRANAQTFLLAGHETTSTATTWTLFALAQKHEIQTKLRNELREARRKALAEGRDELDSRELDALPYLDAVCVRFSPLIDLL